MDGEPEPVPAEQVDQHLNECADCLAWQQRAIEVTRLVRVREVTPTPDLTQRILDDAPTPLNTRGWSARLALGLIALAQLTLGLTQIFGISPASEHAAHDTGPLATHLFNESTAWNLAIGIGLYWAVFRPRAAAGLIPALAAFTLILVAYSTHDLITGTAPASRIAGHSLLLAALILLITVHRQHRHPTPGQGDTLPEPDTTSTAGQTNPTEHDQTGPDDNPNPLRPVGQHRVA
jgi:predicted anti-sigma-YlaC factor YlaD